jgi:5-methyltetrahydropteroyltriglutamate--homocysteine methyltransferase
MHIQTEPIGSIPRPIELILGIKAHAAGQINDIDLMHLYDLAVSDTIKKFEATGSPVISDGEQTKPSFATYPIEGLQQLSPDGVVIPFADGHTRQLPNTSGPFRYQVYGDVYVQKQSILRRYRLNRLSFPHRQ